MIFPMLAPVTISADHPFPVLTGGDLGVTIHLAGTRGRRFFTLIRIPSVLPEFLRLPARRNETFVLLRGVVTVRLNRLFRLCGVGRCSPFEVAQSSSLSVSRSARSLVTRVGGSVEGHGEKRPIHLRFNGGYGQRVHRFLISTLSIARHRVCFRENPLSLAFLSGFTRVGNYRSVYFRPVIPMGPPTRFYNCSSVFRTVHRGSELIRRPCRDFSIIISFIGGTTASPGILTVGRALCHIDKGSPVITTLVGTTRGNGRMAILIRLGTEFSRRGGVR